MYHLSGIAGGVCILASLWLIFELAGTPPFGSPEAGASGIARAVFVGLIAVISGIASMRFHYRAKRDPSGKPSEGLVLVEGLLFTLVGGGMVAGGFLWLRTSGGFLGLHLIGFILGGGLAFLGLRRLGRWL